MITLSQQEDRLYALIAPVAAEMGLDIVRLRVMGGNRPTLQIMIERADGGLASIDQCADLSRGCSPVLDVHDPLPEAYHLEVSTPGIDRPLTRSKDFTRWTGHLVKLELRTPIEGRRRFRGTILPPQNSVLHFDIDDETELKCQLHELSRADLVMTEALLDAAQKLGDAPPQPGDEALADLDVETEDETGVNTDTIDNISHTHTQNSGAII